MSISLVAVADIECPNCSKLALLEGQQMAHGGPIVASRVFKSRRDTFTHHTQL